MVDYIKRKIIEPHGLNGENAETPVHYHINSKKRTELDYYKNAIINAFVPAAFTALCRPRTYGYCTTRRWTYWKRSA